MKKENNLILHFTKQLPENVNASFVAKVNTDLEDCHLKPLCYALNAPCITYRFRYTHGAERIVVNPNNLRFDFSHFSKVTDEELQQVGFC
jgi:alanyl-tRNA synthetase